jgi:DNA ligase-1
VTIGKAYNGLTDAEIRTMTERLLTLTVEDHGHYRSVWPEIVLEVAFNHLQRSARHTSGYALRFPRIVRVRPAGPRRARARSRTWRGSRRW